MSISWKGSALLVATACTWRKCTALCTGGRRKSLPGGALSCGILSYWLVCMDLLVGNESVGDFLNRLCFQRELNSAETLLNSAVQLNSVGSFN